MVTQLVRKKPRISINKLGEYLVATAGQRRAILRAQKRPKTFQTVWYADAEKVLRSWYADPNHDRQILLDGITRLAHLPLPRTYEANKAGSCAEAVDAFLAMIGGIDLDGASVTEGPRSSPKMIVAGVRVSVRPEIIVTKPGRDSTPTLGATKFYFSKTKPLSALAGEYIAVFVRHYAERFYGGNTSIDYRRCEVIDVMSQKIYHSPRAVTRKLDDIEAACEEIAAHWLYI